MARPGLRRLLGAFARQSDGSAAVDAVMWAPIFLVLFGIVTDASMVFGRQAEIQRIIQDTNRSLAVGRFLSVEQAKAYITDKIEVFSDEGDIEITVVDGIIMTSVTVPASDLTSTGLFEAIDSLTVTIGASQMSEL